MGDRTAPAPQPAGRHLDERHGRPDRLFEGEAVASRPTLEEVVAERLERSRFGVDEGASRRDHGIEVDADQALAELALLDPIEHGLDERAQAPRVAGGDHVDRPAHEREPDDAALDDQLGQGLRRERLESRPQSGIGGVRGLGLEADEVLERFLDRQRRPLEQELARQGGAVQGADADRGSR